VIKLLPSQKNELFDLCVDAELDLSKIFFEERDKNSQDLPLATFFVGYRETKYFFETWESPNLVVYYRFSPAATTWIHSNAYAAGWNSFESLFSHWVGYLAREVNHPDKWTLYKLQSEELKLSNVASTEQFSVGEFELLKQQMNVLKEGIKELKLPKDQLKLVESKLDQILEQAKTTSKVNWRDMLIGATFSIIVQLSLSQEQGKALWKLVEQAFTTLFLK
jgi:hypothetical protein